MFKPKHPQNLPRAPAFASATDKIALFEVSSFFQLLKRERTRRRTYSTLEAARRDVFEYIKMFYNPKRKHTNNGMLSPVGFEIRQQKRKKAGVRETRGAPIKKQTIRKRRLQRQSAAT